MLWFNFILGLNFISLGSKLIIIDYHTPKQRKTKFKPRIKLNHNIYNYIHLIYTYIYRLHTFYVPMYTYKLPYIHLIYKYIHFIYTLYRTYIRLIEDITRWGEDVNFIFEWQNVDKLTCEIMENKPLGPRM